MTIEYSNFSFTSAINCAFMNLFSSRKITFRKAAFVLWLALWPLLLMVHFYPIRVGFIRLFLVVGVALLWSGALWLMWKIKALRFAGLAATVVVLGALMLPGRSDDSQKLRDEYVRALKSYKGTIYVWGGETHRGIDCSGLIRCGLIDANLHRGMKTFNPALLRRAFSLWWHDSSALAMKQGYRGQTQLLFTASSLNDADYTRLQTGDIAVTQSSAHVLAYVGDRTWIEADPNALFGDKVVQIQVPTRNAWFHSPMSLMRWRQLETN